MKMLLIAATVGSLVAAVGVAQQSWDAAGVIRGTVTDDVGQRTAGVDVSVLPEGVPMMSVLPHAETDDHGQFAIDHLVFGSYRIYTRKEKDGYLDTAVFSPFYRDAPQVTANLTPKDPVADVLVVIGPKAAIVEGSISDAITGKPLPAGLRVFHWSEDDESVYSGWVEKAVSPQYSAFVPPRVLVGISVRAAGYRVWRAPGPIRLEPGAKISIDIKLQPASR
jgi:hypothetical protein